MPLRAAGLLCLVCLGCHALPPAALPPQSATAPSAKVGPESLPNVATADSSQSSGAARLLPARAALRDDLNLLSKAASCLADGDEQQACIDLGRYVAARPEQRNVRFSYAELLYKLGLGDEARTQFERIIALCQDEAQTDARHLLHCHGRLLALAEAAEDDYEVQLQRGLGLFWLARVRAQLGDPEGELSVEAILCKAAGSLAAAHAHCPQEARPCWYLHEVWRQLAQQGPARRWLREAQAAAPFSYLTPAEHRRLALAGDAQGILKNL